MTFDQLTHLLAVLAWPAVALIGGIAFVHGCRLLVDGLDDALRRLSDLVDRRVPQALGMWLRVTARKSGPVPVDWERERLAATSERALLAVLAANGGFPARQSDDAARMLVREVRKMYEEVDDPTPAPVPSPAAGSGEGGLDPDLDVVSIEDLFGSGYSLPYDEDLERAEVDEAGDPDEEDVGEGAVGTRHARHLADDEELD